MLVVEWCGMLDGISKSRKGRVVSVKVLFSGLVKINRVSEVE